MDSRVRVWHSPSKLPSQDKLFWDRVPEHAQAQSRDIPMVILTDPYVAVLGGASTPMQQFLHGKPMSLFFPMTSLLKVCTTPTPSLHTPAHLH